MKGLWLFFAILASVIALMFSVVILSMPEAGIKNQSVALLGTLLWIFNIWNFVNIANNTWRK